MINTTKYPFVIGGIGGSGTRVFVDILQKAGCYVGVNHNNAKDSLDFVPLYDKWIPDILADNLTKNDEENIIDEIKSCINRHLEKIPSVDTSWGWKNPRSIYLLKYFLALYPEMKFIHVIRDGRDMAFSNNQNQVSQYAKYIFENNDLDQEAHKKSIMFWNKINLSITEFCQTKLNDNYLYVCLEDLCFYPEKTVLKLCKFCDVKPENIGNLTELVQAPKSLGRWKREEKKKIDELCSIGKQALTYYGYIDK